MRYNQIGFLKLELVIDLTLDLSQETAQHLQKETGQL